MNQFVADLLDEQAMYKRVTWVKNGMGVWKRER
jgi:hypothetical protein